MSSNIITRVRYKKDVNFQRLVGGWCKYVSKDGADGKSLKDFSSMNDLYEKEFGIFDDTKNFDEYYIWNKNGELAVVKSSNGTLDTWGEGKRHTTHIIEKSIADTPIDDEEN